MIEKECISYLGNDIEKLPERINEFEVEGCLLEKEKRLFEGNYDNQDVIDVVWTYEAYWSLVWALGLLVQGTDYDDLAYTEVEFGYLFLIENHGLEALYKITTDKGVFYFAAQEEKLMRVEINEEMFKATTEMFLEMHQ